MIKIVNFPSGLRLVMNSLDSFMTVSMGIWVGAGSGNECPSENGMSHFLEHMMFKGTDKRSAFDISETIDSIGGQINAFTTKENTLYYTWTSKEHMKTSCDVLSDMLFHSKFDKVEMDKERGVILEEISMSEDAPEDLCYDGLAKIFFKNNRLASTILGPRENIKSFNKENILSYIDKAYTPENLVISVAGNLDFDLCEELVSSYFEKNLAKRDTKVDQDDFTCFGNDFSVKTKDIEQVHIAFAMPALSFGDPRGGELTLVNQILGGGMTSRLFQNIREDKGLAYSVYSYQSSYKKGGAEIIYAGINPQNVDLAVKEIIGEIKKLKKEKITESEFKRAKEQYKGTLILGQESATSHMLTQGKYLLNQGEEFTMERKIKEIEGISYDDILNIIDTQFDISKLCGSYVGKKEIDFGKIVKNYI